MRKKKVQFTGTLKEQNYSLSCLSSTATGWLYYSPNWNRIELVAEYGGPNTKLKMVVVDKNGKQIGKGYDLPDTYYLIGEFN